MKLKNLFLGLVATSFFSCSSDSDSTNNSNLTLHKRVIVRTQSLNSEALTKEVQYFSNNEIIADTIFNHLEEWTHRKVTTTNGNTKTYKTYTVSGEVTAHREETYDSQGRITGRKQLIPENILAISYSYTADESVTVEATNLIDQTVSYVGTYFKNNQGLIFKENRPATFDPTTITEGTLLFEGLRPIEYTNSANTISFDYYPVAKPATILKSTTELNNTVLLGLSLIKMAEEGNFYFKRNNESTNSVSTTYQTDFNENNFIEYYKSTYINAAANNNLLTTEVFYYYN